MEEFSNKQPKKSIVLSPAQRSAVILKIHKQAEDNPEYKKYVEEQLAKKAKVNEKSE